MKKSHSRVAIFVGAVGIASIAFLAGVYVGRHTGTNAPISQQATAGIVRAADLEKIMKDAYIVPIDVRVNMACMGDAMRQYEELHPDRSLIMRFGDIVEAEGVEGDNTVLAYAMVTGKMSDGPSKIVYNAFIHNNYAPSPEQVRRGNSLFPIIPDAGISGQFSRCRTGGPF